ncbi:MAG TPA: hypothetical protein DEO38_01315 [Bacteroidales bacterium]|nr:hypothetical protein [Bacteroidales bacterium]
MAKDILDPEWEDQEVIDYIIQYLNKDDRERISRKDISTMLDYIVDYYDDQGLIHDDDDDDANEVVDEAEIDEEEMFNSIRERVSADPSLKHIDDDLLRQVLEGEYHYGLSIGIYSDEDDDEPEYGTYND